MARKSKSNASSAAPPVSVVQVPLLFRIVRWTVFSATVAIAIGMLALLDQQLTGISWIYDGALTQYTGRSITIQYCMLSSSTEYSIESRCSFAFAVASVSLVLSFIWSYLQALRRNLFKHPKAKLADLVLCTTWLLFWLAAAVVLCIWADRANHAGSFLDPARNARNGLCVMAWLEFLLVAVLTATAGLLFSPKCQCVFDKYEEKHKQKKVEHEQRRLEAQQAKVAQQEAAAAAAKQAAAHPTPAPAAGGSTGLAPHSAAAAAGPAAPGAPPAAGQAPASGRMPVSTNASAGAGADAAVEAAGRAQAGGAGGDNPFR